MLQLPIIKKISTPINLVVFQVGWFACVLGAAHDIAWLGPLVVLVTAPLQIYFLTEQQRAETFFLILCGVSGFLLETVLILFRIYTPVGSGTLTVCPLWMAALWFNFAPLVSISLSWLQGKYLLAGVLGVLGGPIAYWGGEVLGALNINYPLFRGILPISLAWALALPYLVYIRGRLVRVE